MTNETNTGASASKVHAFEAAGSQGQDGGGAGRGVRGRAGHVVNVRIVQRLGVPRSRALGCLVYVVKDERGADLYVCKGYAAARLACEANGWTPVWPDDGRAVWPPE